MSTDPSAEGPKTSVGGDEDGGGSTRSGDSTDRSGNEVLDRSGGTTWQGEGTASTAATETAEGVDDEPEGRSELTGRDRVLARALAQGLSHEAAGELVGVSSKSVQRRLRDHGFAAALASERRYLFEEIGGQLSTASSEAIKTVVSIMRSGRPVDQLKAAEAVLRLGSRYRRQVVDHDIEERLDRVEELLTADQDQDTGRRPQQGDRR